VDVRVVAATHRDLRREVEQGRFREDLYFRLCVFPLRVPPLRDRPEDIPLLADAFLSRMARQMGRPLAALDEHDVARLQSYSWPGNVRELQNVLEHALILAVGGRLSLDGLLPGESAPQASAGALPENASVLSDAQMRALEAENLRRALRQAGGRVAGKGGAAELLGVPPSTFSSRMRALGIPRKG
jgi:transcriptional regulator with GAF, ATPase, and Fis domain